MLKEFSFVEADSYQGHSVVGKCEKWIDSNGKVEYDIRLFKEGGGDPIHKYRLSESDIEEYFKDDTDIDKLGIKTTRLLIEKLIERIQMQIGGANV